MQYIDSNMERTNQQDKLTNKILEIKLNRIEELNSRLRKNLNKKRIPASSASLLYVN